MARILTVTMQRASLTSSPFVTSTPRLFDGSCLFFLCLWFRFFALLALFRSGSSRNGAGPFQDGDFRIGESAAIVAYLSRTYSTTEKALIPESQRNYAAWLEWCFFIVTELDSTSLYVMRRHRADALGHIYGVAPEVVAEAGKYFRQQLHHVEVALADGRTYLMGDRFNSADIQLTTCLEWAIAYGVGICDNAHPYLERIKQRPGYQRGTAANVPPAPGEPVKRPA